MLTVASWKWGKKYSADYVNRQAAAVKRNLSISHRYVCITDDPRGINCETWTIPNPNLLSVADGCYVRLAMFSEVWQALNGIDRIACLDLDLVIVRKLDPLFDRKEGVVLLRGGHFNPCCFNGSVQLVRSSAHPEVWDDFSVDAAEKVATASGKHLGSDQTWLEHCIPDAASWTHEDGIFGYEKPGWPTGSSRLPDNARIVAFPGHRDPSKFMHLSWVAENWR